jgi:hypothetical protein
MRVDYCSQVDLARTDLLFQNGRYSLLNGLALVMSSFETWMIILFGMSWIDNNGIF